jgi:hypothetical protein
VTHEEACRQLREAGKEYKRGNIGGYMWYAIVESVIRQVEARATSIPPAPAGARAELGFPTHTSTGRDSRLLSDGRIRAAGQPDVAVQDGS